MNFKYFMRIMKKIQSIKYRFDNDLNLIVNSDYIRD